MSADRTVLLTGYPGFLGSALVERLLDRTGTETRVACLVQPAFRARAEARTREIEGRDPRRAGRVVLLDGDITAPDLGLTDAPPDLLGSVVEVYHLAAIYDLGVGRRRAFRVNVDGTRHVLDVARRCPRLERLHYVSTCYVSGRYAGPFTEDDLKKGQAFNNAYEETKHLAEVAVHEAMFDGLPATIYRPAIVVGDSRTGATQKYDGPYALIRWALRWSGAAPTPVYGDYRRAEFNVVPVDFVVDAIAYLSAQERSRGAVYHLADPAPLTVAELIAAVGWETGRRMLPVPIPLRPTMTALDVVPGLEWLTGIEPQSLPYLSHPTHYDTRRAQRDLAGSGIACPPLTSYLGRLVAFVREHPEVEAKAMA